MFTALNVFGLALGLAVSLLLFLHVRQELSFDRYHSKEARIHRVIVNAFWDPTEQEVLANAPNVIGPAMKDNIPAVEQYARLLKHEFGQSAFVTAGENKLVETKLFWADPGLTDIMDIPVIAGNLQDALSQPNTIALSRATAIRYFGTSQPLGRTLQVDRMAPLEVKAVFEDFPAASSFTANVIGSFKTIKWANEKLVWSNASFETWVLLGPDAQRQQVEQQLTALLDKNVPKEDQRFSLWLQPLRDVHLYSSNMSWNYSDRLGDPKQVGILGALALAILFIACFNYMNLSTARSQLRFREVGINKTMGASRRQLAQRFYLETAVLTGISMLLALIMVAVCIPWFNQLADKSLSLQSIYQPTTLAAIAGIGILVVLMAGSYPAIFLSSFLPKNLLQTSFRKTSSAGWLRRSLVTLQFSASVILIIGTIVLYQQMQFVQQKKLGFNPDQVLAITTIAAESKEQIDGLMQGCKNLSAVVEVCRSQSYPGKNTSVRSLSKSEDDEEGTEIKTNRVSPNIEKVLDIQLLAGTTLPPKQATDTIVHVLINQLAAKYLGYTPEDAIGKKISCNLGDNAYIWGVTADFHANSLHKPMGAYAFHDAFTEDRRFLLVKMNTQNLPETMGQIQDLFKKTMPQSAFEFKFLDEHMDSLYRSEQRTAKVVLVFSFLSILISCLGLFGLAAFASEQRSKEIGIRKVLGASVSGITGLLAKDFMTLVGIAILIASPIAWYLMQAWLADFSYHIEIQWWTFALAGLAATLVAGLTVGFQGIKAALINPVQSLKNN
jgi:putative ABC transport system permease protein